MVPVLREIGKRNDIPCFVVTRGLVCDPDLDPFDMDPRAYGREVFQGIIVDITEILREEEVTVGLIVVGIYLEAFLLGAALDLDRR